MKIIFLLCLVATAISEQFEGPFSDMVTRFIGGKTRVKAIDSRSASDGRALPDIPSPSFGAIGALHGIDPTTLLTGYLFFQSNTGFSCATPLKVSVGFQLGACIPDHDLSTSNIALATDLATILLHFADTGCRVANSDVPYELHPYSNGVCNSGSTVLVLPNILIPGQRSVFIVRLDKGLQYQ